MLPLCLLLYTQSLTKSLNFSLLLAMTRPLCHLAQPFPEMLHILPRNSPRYVQSQSQTYIPMEGPVEPCHSLLISHPTESPSFQGCHKHQYPSFSVGNHTAMKERRVSHEQHQSSITDVET